jgi:hypothetical protein
LKLLNRFDGGIGKNMRKAAHPSGGIGKNMRKAAPPLSLRRHQFIKAMPLEGLAAPPPW